MRFKLISCEVFCREIYKELLESPNTVFPVFTQKMSHVYPSGMRDLIQQEINNTDPGRFDYILLGYGLCGNAVNGVYSKAIPLVIPRAHDCCTILLGSKESYKAHFAHRPSCCWTSGGYMESGDMDLRENESYIYFCSNLSYKELVEKYGEDNAHFIVESLTPKDNNENKAAYIHTPPYEKLNFREKAEKEAKDKGYEFEIIEGSLRLLHMLINGIWPEEEFLIVPPGYRVEAVYDQDQVIKAVPG
ncbi:MAG: DUF1638 domain-containing protein [Clostridiaceae bacterium]|jgi:hypothetical protein|nr:DUF1638 domain-containing protein [Clostridiaceae bacterium]